MRNVIRNRNLHKTGFTLTELLIVISLVVLFVTIALPAFGLLTGAKSIGGGENQVGAFLGRARAEAIGLQTFRGMAFYTDAASGRSALAIVQRAVDSAVSVTSKPASSPPTYPQFPAGTYVYDRDNSNYYVASQDIPAGVFSATGNWTQADANAIDVTTDSDALLLPAGVGLQGMINNTIVSSARTSNGYVTYGAVFFDGSGRIVSRPISFSQGGVIGQRANLVANASNTSTPKNLPPITATKLLDSSIALVLYDNASYLTQNPNLFQAILLGKTYASAPQDAVQEKWLDNNSTPILINRYNGTLLKGE